MGVFGSDSQNVMPFGRSKSEDLLHSIDKFVELFGNLSASISHIDAGRSWVVVKGYSVT